MNRYKFTNRRILKISKKILAVGLILLSQEVIAQKKNKKSIAAAKYKGIVVSLTKTHLPSIYQRVINENYCGPDCYRSYVGTGDDKKYISWNMESNEKIVYGNMNTIIHESVHGFNKGPSRHTRGSEFLKFTHRVLVSPYKFIDYEGKDVIKSYKIVDDILANNPKIVGLFRFDTYIGENGSTSSNVSGIYGLLEEFSAYYHGCNASFMIYNNLKKENIIQYYDWDKDDGSTYDTLIMENVWLTVDVAQSCMSHYSSYYEFNVFIGAYLTYVKKNHPVMYDEILDNQAFRRAYSIIDRNFHQLAIKMEKEFGYGFKPYRDSGITYKSGVDNLILGKEIISDYTDILDEFRTTSNLTTKK